MTVSFSTAPGASWQLQTKAVCDVTENVEAVVKWRRKKDHGGGGGSMVANHRSGGESSMVVTTLVINVYYCKCPLLRDKAGVMT